MLKTFRKGILTAAAAVLGAALLGGCGSGTRASDGLVHLNFQIWDNAQSCLLYTSDAADE